MKTNSLQFSRQVADALPYRVLAFLRAVTAAPEIQAELVRAGYTQADHEYGWDKLLQVTGYHDELATAVSGGGAEAIAILDAEDDLLLRRAEAALRRFHPEQADFVFANLAPGRGADAVIAIAKLLERLDALESDPDREATRAQDHEALARLAARGITKEERARLGGLVAKALCPDPVVRPASAASEAATQQALADLRAWHQDWGDTARAVIKRRDYLIRLGLARRKPRQKRHEAAAVTETSVAE